MVVAVPVFRLDICAKFIQKGAYPGEFPQQQTQRCGIAVGEPRQNAIHHKYLFFKTSPVQFKTGPHMRLRTFIDPSGTEIQAQHIQVAQFFFGKASAMLHDFFQKSGKTRFVVWLSQYDVTMVVQIDCRVLEQIIAHNLFQNHFKQ